MVAREWLGLPKSRTQQRIDNNLGIISPASMGKVKKYRDDRLHRLDQYFEGTQYDNLAPWDQPPEAQFVPIRQRKPRINYRFGKRLANEIASMLFGSKRFPKIHVEGDPDMSTYLGLVVKGAKLQSNMVELARKLAVGGSGFVRFYFNGGDPVIEVYDAKYCYPTFDESGALSSMDVIYTFFDSAEVDEKGKPVERWARMTLGTDEDIVYDNPKFDPASEPVFEPIGSVPHGFGFVQGEWFRTQVKPKSVDGDSLLDDVTDLIDELNYSLSQSSQAIGYNQEPQVLFSGMDVDEINGLVKSSQKGWDLGRDGKASFLETNLGAVQTAEEFRDRVRLAVQDVARIILMDPEKFGGQAQSGKAMEVLMAPMVNLIEEIRPIVETNLVSLVTKIAFINLMLINEGAETSISVPPGWEPKSWNVTAEWPPVFHQTIQDLRDKLSVAVQAANATLISRDTLTRWLARDFDIADVELEIQKLAAQPVLNPFGAF